MSPCSDQATSGLTARSVLLGALTALAIAVGAPYSLWVLGSSELTWSYLPVGAIIPFLLTVVLVNTALKLVSARFALSPQELLVVFVMGLVSTTAPVFLIGFFLALLASPYYYATPENNWAGHIHEHLRSWLVPSNENNAMRWFFEGLPKGEAIPWDAWYVPLACWVSLIVALYWVSLCIVSIFRKQWVEHERLVFPLMAIPREMVVDAGSSARTPAFMRSKMFWRGFLVPVAIILWNIVHYFLPRFPGLSLRVPGGLVLGRDFPSIPISLSFLALGAAYFVETKLLFSIWFFYLLSVLQEGLYTRIGFGIGGQDSFVWGLPSISWQSFGAFLAMVLCSLWMAHRHLAQVIKGVLRGRGGPDDSGELLPYRTAVVGALLGLAYIVVWLSMSGMELKVLAIFVPSVFIIYIGITRLVIQGGVYFLVPPMAAQPFAIQLLGSGTIGHRALTSLAMSFSWHGDVQAAFMPMAAQAAKLKDLLGSRRSVIPCAIAIAVPIALVGAICYVLIASYSTGAANFASWTFSGIGSHAFDNMVSVMRNPSGPDFKRLGFLGIGAVAMVVLMVFHYRFLWWPLHPLGLAISSVWTIDHVVLSTFLGWAIKSAVLGIFGVKAYRRMRPLFIGLFLGRCTAIGLSFLVDAVWFGGRGHNLFG